MKQCYRNYRNLRVEKDVVRKGDVIIYKGGYIQPADSHIGQPVYVTNCYRPISASRRPAKGPSIEQLAARAFTIRAKWGKMEVRWIDLSKGDKAGWRAAVRFVQRETRKQKR